MNFISALFSNPEIENISASLLSIIKGCCSCGYKEDVTTVLQRLDAHRINATWFDAPWKPGHEVMAACALLPDVSVTYFLEFKKNPRIVESISITGFDRLLNLHIVIFGENAHISITKQPMRPTPQTTFAVYKSILRKVKTIDRDTGSDAVICTF